MRFVIVSLGLSVSDLVYVLLTIRLSDLGLCLCVRDEHVLYYVRSTVCVQ